MIDEACYGSKHLPRGVLPVLPASIFPTIQLEIHPKNYGQSPIWFIWAIEANLIVTQTSSTFLKRISMTY
jgi:hypothetical protein